jgi:hypothetical protein
LYQLITQIRAFFNIAFRCSGLPAVQQANHGEGAAGDAAGNVDDWALVVLSLELRATQGLCVDVCVDCCVGGLDTFRFCRSVLAYTASFAGSWLWRARMLFSCGCREGIDTLGDDETC